MVINSPAWKFSSSFLNGSAFWNKVTFLHPFRKHLFSLLILKMKFFYFTLKFFPFRFLEDFREKLLGAIPRNTSHVVQVGKICGVRFIWFGFSLKRKLRIGSVHGFSENFLSKQTKSEGQEFA